MKVMNTPEGVDLDITSKCNLRCSYCYLFSSDGDSGIDLSLDEWLTFLEELKECSVLRVCLSGGEPLIRKDFKDIVKGVVANKMRFSVLSNGTLLTDETAEFLKSTNRCESFQVSIDGPGPESHDIFRGDGCFDKAIRGLKILVKNGLPATVRVTIHKLNYKVLYSN